MTDRKFSDKQLLSMLWSYIKKHKLLFLLVVSLLFISISLALVSPLIFNYVLTQAEQGEEIKYIEIPLLAYVIFSLSAWVLSSLEFMTVAKLNARVIRDMRIRAYHQVLLNKVPFFDQQKSGDLTSRIVNDTRELSESARDIAWVLTDVVKLLVTLAVMFYFSFRISVAITGMIPVVVIAAILLGKYERKVSRVWRKKFGAVNARFSEIMSKIQISLAFNRENENLKRFAVINEETFAASKKRAFAIFIFWPFTDLMKHALVFIILLVGTYEVQQHGLTIANLVLFLILANYFYWPLVNIASNYHRFQGAFASLERIAKVSEDVALIELSNGLVSADAINGQLQFRHLTFGYSPEINVLHDLNFTINSGESVAIVGHTGAGKSTIASLLVRLYDVDKEDSLLLDELPLSQYSLRSLRQNIGVVSQRILLFKGTVRENLQIASPDATDAELWAALDQVQAREFIELLPQQLDFIIAENGKNLSVGQRQMISFARAVLANPRIIILDEATASVDLYTEAKIQDAISTLLQNRTSISIAHRLTTILKSDKIIVLDHGRLFELGSHEELLAKNGLYAELYNLYLSTQSAEYLDTLRIN